MAVDAREGALPGRVPSIDLEELALSFAGRSDVAELWERLQAGEQITAPRDRVLVLLAESRAHERGGRFDLAAAMATTALELAEASADAEGAAGGLSHLAYAKYRMGLLEEATKLAEQALAHGAPHAHTVTALLVLGLIALDACRWEEARERFTTARAWSIEVGYRFGVMLALHNLSVVYFHTGRFDLADAAAADVGRLNAEPTSGQ